MTRTLSEEREITVRRLTFRERMAGLATFVFLLNLLVLTLVLVGWLAGWLHFAANRGDVAGQWQVRATLNTSRVAEDMQETIDETRKLAGSLETATEMNTVIGKVVEQNAAADHLTVQTKEGEKIMAELNEATKVEIDGAQTTPSAIHSGDRVELVYQEKDGRQHAVKVARLDKE